MNSTNIPLRDSVVSVRVNGKPLPSDIKLVSLTISEGIFAAPGFSAVLSSKVNTENLDLSTLELGISITDFSGGTFSVSYKATVITWTPYTISGVLIPSDSYYKRRSQSFGNQSLDSIIKSLDITGSKKYTLNSRIQGKDTFFQINETNWQCASRLLDLTGEDYLWAVTEDVIKLINVSSMRPKPFQIGETTGFITNSSLLVKNLPDNLNTTKNVYFGTRNIAVPSISQYPKNCVASLMAKRKYRSWKNVSVSKGSKMKLANVSIGDLLRFQWESSTITDFIVTGLEYTLSQGGNTFIYSFANYKDWNPAGV